METLPLSFIHLLHEEAALRVECGPASLRDACNGLLSGLMCSMTLRMEIISL